MSAVRQITHALWAELFPDHHAQEIQDKIDCQKELTTLCEKGGKPQAAAKLFSLLFIIKSKLLQDAKAAVERDPAASGLDEVILCYPGFLALMTYRLAHELSKAGLPLIPRMMTEHAHALTGCDIHPQAQIGESLFIDHATGVVIGQTSVIGNRVTLFQGVTLGSLALKKSLEIKRHPTLEDDVVIYANATILGGGTIIGQGAVIGGSCWITDSVPPHVKVVLAKPQTNMSSMKEKSIPTWDI